MLILCFGDILSTLADRESVLGVAESQQHLHLQELDRIRHTAEHPILAIGSVESIIQKRENGDQRNFQNSDDVLNNLRKMLRDGTLNIS